MRFRDIPQFISDGSYQVNMSWEYLIEWLDQRVKEEGLQLNPDFQRGHVWTEEQQIKFLEFILQGGKTGRTLYFNDPYWHSVRPKTGYADFVCVDGLQRITAIQRFMNDESVSTYTLNALCNILDCDVSDIVRFYPDVPVEGKKDPP